MALCRRVRSPPPPSRVCAVPRVCRLKQKENKAREAAAGEAAEKTPWEESVKGIEHQFFSMIGVNKEGGDGGEAAAS